MFRRLLTQRLLTSLFLFCILTASFTFAADKPFDQSHRMISGNRAQPIPASVGAAKYSPPSIALNAAVQNTIIGYTYSDVQAVYSMPRLVEHRNYDWLHFAWTYSSDSLAGFPNRVAQYSVYNLSTCTAVYPVNGINIVIERSGFVSMDVVPGSHYPVIGGQFDDVNASPAAFFDYGWGTSTEPLGLFLSESPSDLFGYGVTSLEGTGPGNENIWPKIEMQIGTETVLHMVTSERNPSGSGYYGPVTISYYRRVGDYGQGNGTWSAQRIIDSTNFASPIIAADPNSDRVAIAWIAPCEWYRPGDETGALANDVYYAVSDNQGADWVSSTPGPSISHAIEQGTLSGGNITNYPQPPTKWDYDGREFAYCEVQALFATEGLLHVVWGTRLFADSDAVYYNRGGGIYHWVENSPATDMVYHPPHRSNPEDYACLTIEPYHGDLAYLSLSECANGNLYVTFTRFGTDDNPCGDYDHSGDGIHGTGYMYMTTSDNGGLYWDQPQRITDNPETPEGCSNCGCGYPQCHSEEYASVARYSRTEVCGELAGQEVLDVLYVDDLAPGPAEIYGVKTFNAVRWQVTPCRSVEPAVCYYDDAGAGLGFPYDDYSLLYWTTSNPSLSVPIMMYNGCLIDNHYTVTVEYLDGDGWVTFDKTSGTIPGQMPGLDVLTATFNMPEGASAPESFRCNIIINHEAEGSPRIIPVYVPIFIVDYWNGPTLSTACKRIRVEVNGELCNNGSNASLDYIDDCDTFNFNTDASIYLYDGGPLVGRIDGADTLLFRAFDNWPGIADDDAFRAVDNLEVDSTTHSDYTYARGECITADTSIGCVFEYFLPKAADTCESIFQLLHFYNATDATLTGVFLGGIYDWDVPSDSGLRNGSGFDMTRDLIYQFGAEYNQDDSIEALCGQESSDRFAGVAVLSQNLVKNAMTIDNATYVYQSGPFGTDAPLPAGYVYRHLLSSNGFSLYNSPDPDSLYTDLSTIVTYGQYNLAVGDTITIAQVLSTGRNGLASFLEEIDKAKTWAIGHMLCNIRCCVIPGDANYDGSTNIGDAIFIINYVFRGGPPPPCMNAADSNYDCKVDLGDAIYDINYAFRFGPPPVCGCVDDN